MNEVKHHSYADKQTPDELERSVMAHRFLYYVLAESYLPDSVYDELERRARAMCAEESPVHKLGSSLPSSYTQEQKDWAFGLLAARKRIGFDFTKQLLYNVVLSLEQQRRAHGT